MTWKQRYRVASYLRSSLWIISVAAVVLEQVFAALVIALDARLHWGGLGLGLEGAKVVCNAVITFSLSFIVFTFGSLLVAIQVASGQYTPRIIATTLLSNNVIRYTVGVFVFTLLFAIKALNHIETTIPHLVTFITAVLAFVCLAGFLFLIDYAARLLRPVSLVQRVSDDGLAVLENVYPDKLTDEPSAAVALQNAGPVARTVLHRGTSGVILAVDLPQLIAQAGAANGVIEFAPQVGDFVGVDEPLFLLHGGAGAVDDPTLRDCVIFGSERTMEQDPCSRFASSSISRSRRSPRRSTTLPLPCSPSTSCTACSAVRGGATSAPSLSLAPPELSASFFAHPIGMILSTSPSPRFAFTAHRTSRSRADFVP